MRPFLTAHWSHLCVLSYAAPAEVLRPYLPHGLELDELDGKHYVSLVAFDFENCRVGGVAWPLHRDFCEVNLRFYVRTRATIGHPAVRGVCFVREFVPLRAVSYLARRLYNEPYERLEMTSEVTRAPAGIEVHHKFRHHDRWQEIRVAATREPPLLPTEDCRDCAFIDHEWGFGRSSAGTVMRYRVVHPRWQVFKVQWFEVKVNWAKVYGSQWGFLNGAKPESVILAEGSNVSVFPAAAC